MDYKKSGVDIEAGYKSVELGKRLLSATREKSVMADRRFSGAFSLG